MLFFVERSPSGLRSVAPTWEELHLDQRDVTEPGRVQLLGFMDNAGHQLILKLQPSERLALAVRHTVSAGPAQAPTRPLLVLGVIREDGSGLYAIVQPDGNVLLTSDFNDAG